MKLPKNLPAILRGAGLTVVEVDGWQDRGRPASTGGFEPKGVLCHHTATKASSSNASVVNLLVKGRSDLPGPLCQLGLARNGTVYIIAAGRGNHAGEAKASGNMPSGDGNELYVGIEAFNDGVGEPWGKAQMEAYSILCAVLSNEITKNTSASVRGHKETSKTGKIDPTFDMVEFRKTVAANQKALATPRNSVVRRFAHASLQFSDSDKSHTEDIQKLFTQGFDVITGTEAGPGAGNTSAELLRFAQQEGYRLAASSRYDTWVAVQKDHIVPGSWHEDFIHVFDRSSMHTPKPPGVWGDKGIAWGQWKDRELGIISASSSHPLTRGGAGPKLKAESDAQFATAIGAWGAAQARGKRIAFANGDFNLNDRVHDVFQGHPFTSCWDELEKWPNTLEGHNTTLDVIASYDKDGRVKCLRARAYRDKRFFLNSDHLLITADYAILLPG